MRVLVLHSELGVLRGGGENFTRHLFTAFGKLGHHVSVAFVADPGGRYPFPLPSNFEPIPLPGLWSRKFGQSTMSFLGRHIPNSINLKQKWNVLQDALDWRIIRLHQKRFQMRVERRLGAQWKDYHAVYVHGDTLLAGSISRYCPTVLRLPGPAAPEAGPLLRRANVVCANGDVFNRLRVFLGDHVKELPIGLDDQKFKPGTSAVRSKLGWHEGNLVFGYVGRLAHLKGVDVLANAFREVTKVRHDARLLIVGSGESEAALRAILAKELLRGVVHIESDVDHDHLPDWYRAMDYFVMPSRYENFSNALLEAMACAIPFIASNVGGNRLMREANAGVFFDSDSVSSLCSCLMNALDNPCQMTNCGKRGARYIAGRFNWRASAKRLENIIEPLLERTQRMTRISCR